MCIFEIFTGVRRSDGSLAFPTAIRLLHTNDEADKMREFRNTDGSPVEFRVLDGASMSIMNLPTPIEARYLRLNMVNFTNQPCMRLELMGCQKTHTQKFSIKMRENFGQIFSESEVSPEDLVRKTYLIMLQDNELREACFQA